MDVTAGDKITLAQDEEDPYNWYFFKDPEHGFALRLGYGKKGCLINHAVMKNEMMNALGLDADANHNFLMAGKPTVMDNDKAETKYWGIIIKKE